MSNQATINLPTLISKLSAVSGTDMATARRFLHDVFAIVEDRLSVGESVAVPGVGEFAKGLGPDHAVLFRPASSLSAIANEPFSAFSPVEIFEGAERIINPPAAAAVDEQPASVSETPDESDLKTESEKLPSTPATQSSEPRPDIAIVETEQPKAETTETVEGRPTETDLTETNENPAPIEKTSTFIPPKIETVEPYIEPATIATPQVARTSHTIWLVLGIMIGLVVGLVGGYFAGKSMGRVEGQFVENGYSYEDEVDNDVFNEAVEIDIPAENLETTTPDENTASAADTPTQDTPIAEEEHQSPEPVYDHVTKNLASLAQKHYGNKNYWVFIYKANPNLGNPNMIAPNQRLRIPAYEEFAGTTKKETNEKAQSIYNELARKYKF